MGDVIRWAFGIMDGPVTAALQNVRLLRRLSYGDCTASTLRRWIRMAERAKVKRW